MNTENIRVMAVNWKEHWPAAKECPQCGATAEAFLFRHLCRHSDHHVQPLYDTWLECTSCGRKGRPVSKPFQTWYLDQLCGDDSILIAAIDNWNRDLLLSAAIAHRLDHSKKQHST